MISVSTIIIYHIIIMFIFFDFLKKDPLKFHLYPWPMLKKYFLLYEQTLLNIIRILSSIKLFKKYLSYFNEFLEWSSLLNDYHFVIFIFHFYSSLQVVTNRDTQETLLCIAYVFEVSTSEHGAQHHIYRLVKDWN